MALIRADSYARFWCGICRFIYMRYIQGSRLTRSPPGRFVSYLVTNNLVADNQLFLGLVLVFGHLHYLPAVIADIL